MKDLMALILGKSLTDDISEAKGQLNHVQADGGEWMELDKLRKGRLVITEEFKKKKKNRPELGVSLSLQRMCCWWHYKGGLNIIWTATVPPRNSQLTGQ
jgi:hypothetical protein